MNWRRRVGRSLYARGEAILDWPEPWDRLYDVVHASQVVLCVVGGHVVVDDQCMRPEHRYCIYCEKQTPHAKVAP